MIIIQVFVQFLNQHTQIHPNARKHWKMVIFVTEQWHAILSFYEMIIIICVRFIDGVFVIKNIMEPWNRRTWRQELKEKRQQNYLKNKYAFNIKHLTLLFYRTSSTFNVTIAILWLWSESQMEFEQMKTHQSG